MVQLDVRKPIVIQRDPLQDAPSSLSIIEAAYDLESDDDAWLATLVHQVQPFIDSGLGLYGHLYEFQDEALRVDSAVFLGCAPGLIDVLVRAGQMMEPEHLRLAYFSSPCRSFSQVCGDADVPYTTLEGVRFLEQETGIADVLTVNSWQEGQKGCCLVAPLSRRRGFPSRTASVLSRVARHIAAAQRLRRCVRRGQGCASLDAEAVLDEGGRVLHAEGEAKGKLERELLAQGVRSIIDTQRRFRDTDPEQVTSTWNALVDGRWSLVDSFDRDGKRFLLARRNGLELHEPSALSPSERQIAALSARGHSTKLVAYELGMSPSAVSGSLQRALRKLHLRSRTELVALFSGH